MTAFRIPGAAYKELATTIKPHISKDYTLPTLQQMRIRAHAGAWCIDATDSYSAIRASGTTDHQTSGPIDVVVPGTEFVSLRPDPKAEVSFDVHGGYSELTDGVTTVRLDHFDVGNTGYPDLDKIVGGLTPATVDGHQFAWSASMFKKLAALPKGANVLVTTHRRDGIYSVWAEGHVGLPDGLIQYHLGVMPIRMEDRYREKAVWHPWTQPVSTTIAEAS